MSTETCDHDDLIDLHVGSPVLPRSSASDVFPEVSDNLIDTELPMLEQKLQIASQNRPPIDTRRISVDIEDILISIDDDYDVTDAPPPKISNQFFGICDTNTEALDVLKSLDEVLHASLLESEDILNDNDDTQAQQDIEDCLQDLDNYLKAQDSSTCSASNTSTASTSTDDCSSLCTSSQCTTEGQSCPSYNDEESLRKKLRQIEENYTRFLASGCVNRGYVDTETIEGDGGRIRPLSACDAACSEAKKRKMNGGNRPERATVAVVRRERPSLRKGASESRRNRCTSDRTSASFTSAESDSEDIDWSWVQEVNPQSEPASVAELDMERRAHASNDRCTGTVVVEEPPRRSDVASRSEPAMLHEEAKVETATVAVPLAAGGTWLRSSMRRLRHLRLPSGDAAATAEAAGEPERTGVELNGEALLNRGAIDPPRPLNSTRPVSAPSRLPPRTPVRSSRSRSRETRETEVSHEPGGRARSSSASSRSRRARSSSSSMSSIPSSVDSTPSRTTAASPTTETQEQGNTNGSPRRSCERNRQSDMPEVESPLGHWPNSLSSMMACLGCTLGLFNISRFAILTVHFGMNFIFQFVFLSVVFGLPLFTLQLCLGQQLGAGVIDMWRISPLFQGVGVSLLIAHAFLGLYSIIGVSWMFVFFRDSFITKMDKYRWAESFGFYRREQSVPVNATYKLTETIPDYFNGVVLQRHHLPSDNSYATIKFQLAFNLAVVWMIVFVSLSKGLRSYGKVIYAFTLLPVFGTFILCAKILGLMPPEYVNVIFPETAWDEFFLNPKSWLAAGQETFLTWGLLGAAIMQIASHNKHKHLLQRDSSLVAVITFTVLMLVAFLANTCVQILRSHGYSYLPSSFERMSSYTFLRSAKDPLPLNLANTKVRHMVHQSFIVGDRILKPNVDITMDSGYQVLRLATELVPATFAVMGSDQVSPFWAVLFYFILIMFGIAQQLAIWHCVITGIMAIKAKVLKSWETTITFFSCACGFILGLPMATELGIYVVYFFDYTIGGIWWLVIVILMQIIAVFMVRGRPYSGDTVVTALFYQSNHPCFLSWIPPLLSFTWNVILPVALMVLCIATFKNGSFRDMFIWHHAPVAEYWPLWARQIGSMMQLLPILCIPLVAVIQSYRYLNNGPNDILDRIQLLYRPPIGEHMDELAVQEAAAAIHSSNQANALATEDPPPKYTPPPSYTTATGARLAKYLRQSIRRSVRRIANVLGESSNNRHRSTIVQAQTQLQPPPPDYNAVLVEMNNTNTRNDVSITMPDVTDSTVRVSTLERLRNLETTSTALTAAEVASILRSSFRRSTIRNGNNVRNVNFTDSSLSARNLVDSAAPIGETSLVMEHLSSDIENKFNNNTSVI